MAARKPTAKKPKPPTEAELAWERRKEEIRLDARSGRNWAAETSYGSACACGAGERTYAASVAFQGEHGRPDEKCYRHPGGTVYAPAEGLWETMKKEGRA